MSTLMERMKALENRVEKLAAETAVIFALLDHAGLGRITDQKALTALVRDILDGK